MGFTMTLRELIKYLESKGFTQGTGGKHQIKMIKGKIGVAIPSHKGNIPKGTINAILREAGTRTGDAKKWKEGRKK